MPTFRPHVAIGLGLGVLALTGCSAPASPVTRVPAPTTAATSVTPSATPTPTTVGFLADPTKLAEMVSDQVERDVGNRPNIGCGTELMQLTVGTVVPCTLYYGPDELDVTVTITRITPEQGDFGFSYAIAEQPRKKG